MPRSLPLLRNGVAVAALVLLALISRLTQVDGVPPIWLSTGLASATPGAASTARPEIPIHRHAGLALLRVLVMRLASRGLVWPSGRKL